MGKSTKPNDLGSNHPVFRREVSIWEGRGVVCGPRDRINGGLPRMLCSLLRLLGGERGRAGSLLESSEQPWSPRRRLRTMYQQGLFPTSTGFSCSSYKGQHHCRDVDGDLHGSLLGFGWRMDGYWGEPF